MSKNPHHNALDILENEDRRILATFAAIDTTRDGGEHLHTSLEKRAQYGDLVKRLLREVGTREAAQADVVRAFNETPDLSEVVDAMRSQTASHRSHIDAVETMSRGVPGMALNTGQDSIPDCGPWPTSCAPRFAGSSTRPSQPSANGCPGTSKGTASAPDAGFDITRRPSSTPTDHGGASVRGWYRSSAPSSIASGTTPRRPSGPSRRALPQEGRASERAFPPGAETIKRSSSLVTRGSRPSV